VKRNCVRKCARKPFFPACPGWSWLRPERPERNFPQCVFFCVFLVFLAGDWNAGGGPGPPWPRTMEGAVRSGYLAAEACGGDAGKVVLWFPDKIV